MAAASPSRNTGEGARNCLVGNRVDHTPNQTPSAGSAAATGRKARFSPQPRSHRETVRDGPLWTFAKLAVPHCGFLRAADSATRSNFVHVVKHSQKYDCRRIPR